MNNMKKIIVTFLSLFTIVSLFACGVNKQFAGGSMVAETAAPMLQITNGFTRASMKQMAVNDMADYSIEEAYEADVDSELGGKKLIKTVSINSETQDFDGSVKWLKSYIESLNGIIDSSYIDTGNKTNPTYRKSASFNVRIPVESADNFLLKVGTELNVTFEQENVRDVTDTYNDTESRIKTLNLEEEKLNELLKKAKSIEDIIKIEEKLSDVRSELRNITNRLKGLDKQIDYTTFNISIMEVLDLTEYIEKEDYSKANLLKQLNKNFEATKRFIINTGVYLFVHIPAICLGLIVIVVILIIILIIRTAGKVVKTKNSNKNKGTSKDNKNDNKDNKEN